MSGEQDMRKMGGLASRLPWTHATMLVATIAIAGIPPLAGFFSKDEILGGAFATGHFGVWLVGLVTAMLTAFYMFRLYILTFRGPSRLSHEAEHHLHESPASMIVPLAILAVLSIVGGWIGPPEVVAHGANAFHRWLEPVFAGNMHGIVGMSHPAGAEAVPGPVMHEVSEGTEWLLIALSVVAAVIGIAFAFRVYLQAPDVATGLRKGLAPLHRVLHDKYGVDELYDRIVVRPIYRLSEVLWRFWDEVVVDGTVNAVGWIFESLSSVIRLFQTGIVGTYAFFFTMGAVALFFFFSRH
jgi:NADH-quinone oxidoreductase subunit L